MATQKSPQEKTVSKSRDKSAKFRELAVKRTNAAIAKIAKVGALADRRSYTYTADESAKVLAALETAVAGARKRYENAGSAADAGFSL